MLTELNEAVTRIPGMPRVAFNPQVMTKGSRASSWLTRNHLNGTIHEAATAAAFMAIGELTKPKVIFDIGALYGYYSLLCTDILFPKARVTAFEMHPAGMISLRANCEPRTRCVQTVISDHIGRNVKIWVSGYNIFEQPPGGWRNLLYDKAAMKQRGPHDSGRGFTRANFITIDEYCSYNEAPDIIKIDVEAYQAKAVNGGLKTFKKHRPHIILELHDPEKVERMGTTNQKTIQPLLDMGYRAYWCGNRCDTDAVFEEIDEIDKAHDRISIVVFAP